MQSIKAVIKSEINKSEDNGSHNMEEKHHRRYHYYVSQRIIKESKTKALDAQRIPAQELEQVFITRLHQFLKQGSELIKLIDANGLINTHAVDSILQTASKIAETLDSEKQPTLAASLIQALQSLIERIIVLANELIIIVKFDLLIAEAKAASHAPPSVWKYCDWEIGYTITMPV